jgi:membrane protease YdiL (CAAX protease family)
MFQKVQIERTLAMKLLFMKKTLSILLLLLGLASSIIFIAIVWGLLESIFGHEPMEMEDNILTLVYLVISGILALIYWGYGIKVHKKAKLPKNVYVKLKLLFVIVGLLMISLSCLFGWDYFSSSFNPFSDFLTLLLFLIGVIHIVLFIILCFPNVKNNLLES